MAAKLRSGDEVIVISGKDKGKTGKILRVSKDGRGVVEGVQLTKKHQKPNPAANVAGGIIEKERAIHLSNVAILNTTTGKADRIGFKIEQGKKVRFLKSTKALLQS